MKFERIKIDLNYIRPETSLVYPIYSEEGLKLLDERTAITSEKIKEIKLKFGNFVYYVRKTDKALASIKIIKRAEVLSRDILEEISKTDKLSKTAFNETEKVIEEIITDIKESDLIAINLLTRLKSHEEYLYHHSVNVGILTALFAKRLGKFSRDEIKNISLGGYLIDIGLMKVDRQLLNKEGKFNISDIQKMKRHPQLGYELLKGISGINPIVLQTVLFHHETYNDMGYFHLPYSNLPLPPKLVSIADTFDALTSVRPYRDAFSAKDALLHLVNLTNTSFSHELVKVFINCLVPVVNNSQFFYDVGDFIEIDSREIAIIEEYGSMGYLTPRVLIFCNFRKVGKNLQVKFYNRPVEVDLEKDVDRKITKFIINRKQIESFKKHLKKRNLLLEYLEGSGSFSSQ